MSHARVPFTEGEPELPRLVARTHRPADASLLRLSDRILDAARDGILFVDSQGRIAFANAAAANIIGYAVDELRGQPVRTHLQFSDFNPGELGLDEPPQTAPLNEDLCWREDGSSFPIEYERAPLFDDDRIIGTVVTFRDISHRRAIEQLRDEHISIVSHELRTPLTSIRSALGLLATGQVAADRLTGKRMLDIAVSNIDRLIRLVNDMLDLERLESGLAPMHTVVCNVGELIRLAADSMRAYALASDVTIDTRAHEVHVWGDPDRLVQVLINLLSNAIKFSPPGGGTVWLEAEAEHGELLIRVRDEGRGIPAQMLESIFDRFQQVEHADARDKGGTGLGLAICRSIVEQHDGQVWAESTVGAGTTICVALPCIDPAAPRGPARLRMD